jgi:hypothetical protein
VPHLLLQPLLLQPLLLQPLLLPPLLLQPLLLPPLLLQPLLLQPLLLQCMMFAMSTVLSHPACCCSPCGCTHQTKNAEAPSVFMHTSSWPAGHR